MITAEEAKNISENCRFTYIENQIKKASNKGLRSVSLINNYFLKEDEKKKLKELGYRLNVGSSGKHGTFDIISW